MLRKPNDSVKLVLKKTRKYEQTLNSIRDEINTSAEPSKSRQPDGGRQPLLKQIGLYPLNSLNASDTKEQLKTDGENSQKLSLPKWETRKQNNTGKSPTKF